MRDKTEAPVDASDAIGLGPVAFATIAEALENQEDEIQISMAA